MDVASWFPKYVVQNQNMLALGAVVVWSLANTWWRIRLLGFIHNRFKRRYAISRGEFDRVEYIFKQRIPYFAELSDEGRARFINRAIDFAEQHAFIGVEGFEVTREVKVMIGAAAAQISWGLELTELHHIERILVYPKAFYHATSRTYLKGGVSKAGTMLLSWEDFCAGYEIARDNRNLGVHEMAHALKLGQQFGSGYNSFYRSYLKSWLQISRPAFKAIQSGECDYFRAYGGSNDHEFFAVCVEHFFESPESFYRKHPNVYGHLCVVLNQDPLNANGDYRLDEDWRDELIRETGRKRLRQVNSGYKDFNRFHRQAVYALIVGIVAVFITSSLKIKHINEIHAHGAMLALFALGIQVPYILKQRYLPPNFLALFILATWGLMHLVSLILMGVFM